VGRVTVKAGETLDAWVTLYPVATGSGTLTYAVRVPGDTASALLRVYALPEIPDAPPVLLDLYAGKTAEEGGTLMLKGALDLDAGFYRAALDIALNAGDRTFSLRKHDAVHIYDGLDTPASYAFAREDFSPGSRFSDLESLKTWLAGRPENTPDTPYLITLTMNLSDLAQGGDDLGGLFDALSRYAALDLRSCALGGVTSIAGSSANGTPRSADGKRLVSLYLPEGIKTLGDYAFYNCPSLEYITLPEALTSIGSSAFRGSSLQTFPMPQGVKSLGEYAFEGCSRLERIDLSTLESLGANAFFGCSSLIEAILPPSLPGNTLPGGIFYNCTALETVKLPAALETIGGSAFYGCQALSGLELPPTIKTIGSGAFSGCSKITPDIGSLTALETLGLNAFKDCAALLTVSLPASISSIGQYAFQGCIALTLAEIPANLVSLIDYQTFDSCRNLVFSVGGGERVPWLILEGALKAWPAAWGDVTFPEGITAIADRCFYGSSALGTVSLPASLKTIGTYAFRGCTNMVLAPLPVDSLLETIGHGAFEYCSGITAVNLPATVTEIGNSAFYTCSALERLVCAAVNPPSLGNNALSRVSSSLAVSVPAGSVDAYKAAAEWSGFAALIGAITP
jgi:hypothetical protein